MNPDSQYALYGPRATFLLRHRSTWGAVLARKFPPSGGPSFGSAVEVAFQCGLYPLRLQGLKPLIRGIVFVGTEVPTSYRIVPCYAFQIRTAPNLARRFHPNESGCILEVFQQC